MQAMGDLIKVTLNSDIDMKILFSKVDSPENPEKKQLWTYKKTPKVACVQGESTLENSISISISELNPHTLLNLGKHIFRSEFGGETYHT